MKKALLIIGAVTLMMAGFASQSSAGVSVHFGIFAPVPAYVVPAPIVYERVQPIVMEERVNYRVPAGYYRVEREDGYRDCDRWDRDRYWGYADWHRDRDERHWREERHWQRERRFEDR